MTTSTAKATIAAADDIKYAITDGEEPADWSVYSAEVSITSKVAGTKTLWAKAVKGTDESAVVSKEFKFEASIENTQETAYTTEQAIALIDATSTEQLKDIPVFVKGIISSVTSLNSDKSITYLLDDAFTVYKGKNIGEADFASKEDLEVGAKVVAYGNLTKYNSTYELNSGNYLVEYTAPATTQSIAINGNATKTEYLAGETFLTDGLEVVATLSDGSTLDVTNSAAWTIEPETLAVGTTTVKVTATYKEFSASKDVAVTVSPAVTLDLSTTTQIKGEPTEDLLEYDATVLTVSTAKLGSTAANNYYGGKGSYTSTRFYKDNSLTFTPAANYEIISITYNATSEGYANALATSTWENASATIEDYTVKVASTICYPVTIVPNNGTQPFSAIISGTTGAKSMVIKYKELPIATEEGLDALLIGEVGKKYQINCVLRVNHMDANYVYASTTENNSSKKNTANEGDKGKGWSDKEEEFTQNDWVAIQNSGLELGDQVAIGSVATLVSNGAFPVIEFVSMSKDAPEKPFKANTFRVANFNIGKDVNAVKYVWLVAPQAGEFCHVRGYVEAAADGKVTLKSAKESSTETIGGTPITVDPVEMTVNYTGAVTTGNWFSFTGIVVKNGGALELNAISAEDVSTGVEGVEASSVKVYGAEGVINVVSEEVAPIAVYSANGAIVSSVEASSASIAVAPGFYIVKAGNSVSKVTVK